MNEKIKNRISMMKNIVKATSFNHDKDGQFKAVLDPDKELTHYDTGITQLTLPHRFGLYKTPTKDIPKTTKVDLEDPPFFPDSTSSRFARNPNHKVRSIFD